MELNKDSRDRIFSAADALYEQAGRADFPTVDAVRKAAKVNMGDASSGMKEWRRAQTAQAAPLAVQVPESVQQASSAALVALWTAAQDQANESLKAAQAGWDSERTEANTLNQQMAEAFELQVAELDAARREVAELKSQVSALSEDRTQLSSELASAKVLTDRADARTIEIEKRAGELRTELDAAHRAAEVTHDELATARGQIEVLQSQAEELRAKLATAIAGVETAKQTLQDERKLAGEALKRVQEQADQAVAARDQERVKASEAREEAARALQDERKLADETLKRVQEQADKAGAARDQERARASEAREEAAKRSGQIEAMTAQIAELMGVIAAQPKDGAKVPDKPKKS